jgi:drug/metabolite transporter (DMT)-like permease
VVGATVDPGGAAMATRMLGGFILVAFLFCLLLAWPGRRRWPIWLIMGLSASVTAALAMSLIDAADRWFGPLRSALLMMAAAFVGLAALRDLRRPLS